MPISLDSTPAPAPVKTPRPEAIAVPPTVTARAPKDALKLSGAIAVFNLPFASGQNVPVTGHASGFDFSGNAQMSEVSGRRVDLTIDASVLFVSAKVHLRFTANADNTVSILAERTDSGKPEPMDMSGETLKVISRSATEMNLEDSKGQRATLRSGPDGKASIEYGDLRVSFAN